MTLSKMDEGIYVDDAISLNDVDAIIFDCDGVLIDVANSYDKAIIKTTDFILKEFANVSNAIPITSQIIDAFKKTGGFNDEVDLTYASIISLTAADKLNKDGTEFIFQVIQNADETGINSVEKYLDSLNADISEIRKKLNYPGRHSDNPLYSIFDQLFYGPELYQKLFNKTSQFTDNGFIENDKVIVSTDLLDKLKKKFNQNIAIVTGRGYDSISYSLKGILEQFNIKNSVFLEDEPRELAKPNPESLLRSIKGLNSNHTIFVGDSMEDFIMAKKATENGNKTTFCGIIGTTKEPDDKRNFFEKNDTKLILDSIQLLPKVLNLV
ncbi:MAG: HAD family hydrolase [Nitrosopumilaceae archaeon]